MLEYAQKRLHSWTSMSAVHEALTQPEIVNHKADVSKPQAKEGKDAINYLDV